MQRASRSEALPGRSATSADSTFRAAHRSYSRLTARNCSKSPADPRASEPPNGPLRCLRWGWHRPFTVMTSIGLASFIFWDAGPASMPHARIDAMHADHSKSISRGGAERDSVSRFTSSRMPPNAGRSTVTVAKQARVLLPILRRGHAQHGDRVHPWHDSSSSQATETTSCGPP
jgi:hypothetical protein